MSDYTPDLEDVRDFYRDGRDGMASADFLNGEHPFAEFDRWLAAHDAEVYRRGREDAAQAVEAMSSSGDPLTPWQSRWVIQGEAVAAARGDGAE